MVEFALPDLHLGKLAWSEETGHGNWDLKIAENVYKEAIEDLLSRSPEAEEAWLIVGNDFFNVDNDAGTTTAGTPQDEDGRWQKTFKKGKEILLWSIGRLRKKYSKVKVIVVYGNHDKQRTYYVGEVLAEAAKSMTGVEVDNRPLDRKFFQWGDTGLGFTHGDRIKVRDLAHLVQNEARQIWGNTKRFELHLGHLHQDIVKSLGGVTVRWIPALCPPDAWHSKSGYTMSEKAAMLFEYDQSGMKNLYVHYPRKELFE
jgi:predicted phosphodiesterase